jgi:hypothetical protein
LALIQKEIRIVKNKIGIACLVALGLSGSAWAGQDKTNQAPHELSLELKLIDGSRIIGVPTIKSVSVQTSYAKMDIALKQILTIAIEDDHETASLALLNADKLKGVITMEPIKLETVFGTVAIGVEHIRELRVVPSGWGGCMTNVAREASVAVNRSSPGNGLPAKVNDGVTNDVDQPASYWYAGDWKPQPDWIRLRFDKPARIRSIKILAPMGTVRFGAGHAPLDYEIIGLSGGQENALASVKNGEHPKTEPGPTAGVEWIVVELTAPKMLEGVQLTCRRTSGENYGPVIFEIQTLGIR